MNLGMKTSFDTMDLGFNSCDMIPVRRGNTTQAGRLFLLGAFTILDGKHVEMEHPPRLANVPTRPGRYTADDASSPGASHISTGYIYVCIPRKALLLQNLYGVAAFEVNIRPGRCRFCGSLAEVTVLWRTSITDDPATR